MSYKWIVTFIDDLENIFIWWYYHDEFVSFIDTMYWVGKKFLSFFFKFTFYFLISTIQRTFYNLCSITIYDLSPMLW